MSRISRLLVFAIVALGLGRVGPAHAQCLLANPSFELSGSGATFGGWNQFGPTGSSTVASHGHRAARASGPNNGVWGVAGFWQPLDTAPGEKWVASVRAWNRSTKPLTGGSTAILNIEWRNAGNGLISYESHPVANASSQTDRWIDFSVTSAGAPTGAVQARLLLGVLQGPTDPQPEVLFDQATLEKAGPPTLDAIQWNDFPGGRTINFSGRTWRVKGPGYYGPGPNLFCNSASCVWVDGSDHLHITLQNISGQWYSTEVVSDQALGYGDYVFTTVGRLDQLDPNAVLGLFLWQYGRCYDPAFLWWNPFNEIDVEFSRWGDPGNSIAQFVAQPYDYPGNIQPFDATFSANERTSHAFQWLSDRIVYRSWRGGPQDESPASLIHSWTYAGPHIPRPEQPRVHLNLWRFAGTPGSSQEVVFEAFAFVSASTVDVLRPGVVASGGVLLAPAQPNPFVHSTRIRYTLPRDGRAELAVHDVTGRLVCMLVRGLQSAGPHDVVWDGLDAEGQRLQPGIYLYRLATGTSSETGRVVLLR